MIKRPADPTLEEQARLYEEANKNYTFPDNATPRWEYIKCRRPGCFKCAHVFTGTRKHVYGPYLYVYWKEKGKLRKAYVGKDIEDYEYKKRIRTGIAYTKGMIVTNTSKRQQIGQWKKIEYVMKEAKKGNDDIVQKYWNKLNRHDITVDWAYRMVKKRFDERFWEKVFKASKKEGIKIRSGWARRKKDNTKYYVSYQDACRNYVSNLMKKNGLKTLDEFENWLDSYINYEFM